MEVILMNALIPASGVGSRLRLRCLRPAPWSWLWVICTEGDSDRPGISNLHRNLNIHGLPAITQNIGTREENVETKTAQPLPHSSASVTPNSPPAHPSALHHPWMLNNARQWDMLGCFGSAAQYCTLFQLPQFNYHRFFKPP